MGVVVSLEEKKSSSGSVQPLVDLTKADMGRVNELILSKAGSDVEMIPEVCQSPDFLRWQAFAPNDHTGCRTYVRL